MTGVEQMFVTAMAAFMAASGGFWVYLRHRVAEKDAHTILLLSLSHYRIVDLGMEHINKGYVSKEEYDDLLRHFYEPYLSLGGNGSVERIMKLVQRLPLAPIEADREFESKLVSDIQSRAHDLAEHDRLRMDTAEELVKRKVTARILHDAEEIERKRREDERRRESDF